MLVLQSGTRWASPPPSSSLTYLTQIFTLVDTLSNSIPSIFLTVKASLPFNVIRQGRFQQMFQPFSCFCTPITYRHVKWQTALIKYKETLSACHFFLAALNFPLSQWGSEDDGSLSIQLQCLIWPSDLSLHSNEFSICSGPFSCRVKKKKKDGWALSLPTLPRAATGTLRRLKIKPASVLYQWSNYLTVVIICLLSKSARRSLWLKSGFGFNLVMICQGLLMQLETWSRREKNGAQMEKESLKCLASAVMVMAVGLVGGWWVIGMCNKL